MKLLELFSGTGSVGEPWRAQGHEVISVDVDPRFLQPGDIHEDILQLDYKSLPWVPDVLWGSPPCTEYSRAKTTGHRNLALADRLVAKWLEIRDYFLGLNPAMLWFCENGASTLLWERGVSATLWPRVTTSYCQYSGPGYQKHTTFATNARWVPRPKCDPKTCPQVVNGCHLLSAQQGPSKERGIRRKEDACPRDLLHSIPKELCEEIYRVCTSHEWEVV